MAYKKRMSKREIEYWNRQREIRQSNFSDGEKNKEDLQGNIAIIIIVIVCLLCVFIGAICNPKTKVSGYYRSNGTYVEPYERKR
ncbi:hypothetical protein [Rhizosphaericola mali]|uniref:Uncharacterized protein n=1 Tax=Rhizosphaericola mali TaxID=2545455 RepID=A0A5P2G248_9BACT|nr:hypothetical protein [Rhizosphaericola mali]QES87902.1 hypothetical protein E0W69_004235 [Rhizosphaericola mali]